jgi:hypothetical protein
VKIGEPVTKSPTLTLLTTFLAALPVVGYSQPAVPLDWKGKLSFHAKTVYEPQAIAGFAAYAGALQALDTPKEWGQGADAYGKRVASTAGWAGIYATLAFGLDSTLHEDPRYYRSGGKGFWRRTGHALRGTLLTRTDSGGETLSVWRIGAAYGSTFLSNEWYPDRLNTVRLGFLEGTVTLGFGFVGNMGAEFWPDIKRKIFRKK